MFQRRPNHIKTNHSQQVSMYNFALSPEKMLRGHRAAKAAALVRWLVCSTLNRSAPGGVRFARAGVRVRVRIPMLPPPDRAWSSVFSPPLLQTQTQQEKGI